jgi:hypothetical protein
MDARDKGQKNMSKPIIAPKPFKPFVYVTTKITATKKAEAHDLMIVARDD